MHGLASQPPLGQTRSAGQQLCTEWAHDVGREGEGVDMVGAGGGMATQRRNGRQSPGSSPQHRARDALGRWGALRQWIDRPELQPVILQQSQRRAGE